MALQGSGTISLSQIASEFGDTTPNSMSEFYKGGSLVPDTSDIDVTATKSTNGATSDFGSVTGLTVTRSTDTNTINALTSSQFASKFTAGTTDFPSNYGSCSGTAEPAAMVITLAANERIDLSIPIAVYTQVNWSDWSGSELGFTNVYTSGSYSFGGTTHFRSANGAKPFSIVYEVQTGSASDFTFGGTSTPFSKDLSTITCGSHIPSLTSLPSAPSVPNSNVGAGSSQSSTANYTATIVGTASQATTIKVLMYIKSNDYGFDAFGPTGYSNWTFGTSTSSQTVYDFSVTNGTGHDGTANSTSVTDGSTVTISNDNASSSLSVNWVSTQTRNTSVPTSGEISFSDFYGAEDD